MNEKNLTEQTELDWEFWEVANLVGCLTRQGVLVECSTLPEPEPMRFINAQFSEVTPGYV